ncbi:MAG TPA: tetratricopeptide repeat protein [Gammaproteobacteria bacterium]|nr:tetratricopeptide repeat protein [Gammaproteobacteria bacterium]
MLGRCLAATGDFVAAGHYLSHAIELASGQATPYLHLGDVNVRIGRAQQALRCYQRAVQLRSGDTKRN